MTHEIGQRREMCVSQGEERGWGVRKGVEGEGNDTQNRAKERKSNGMSVKAK